MGKYGKNGLTIDGATVERAAYALEAGLGGGNMMRNDSMGAGREVPSGASSSQGISEGSERDSPHHSSTLSLENERQGSGLLHPCEQVYPPPCSQRGEFDTCPLRGLPREWCPLCLQGQFHEECLGVMPPTHPCERVWGFCRYGDRCMYRDMPRIWCLRCVRGIPHTYCDSIKPDVYQDYAAKPEVAATRDVNNSFPMVFEPEHSFGTGSMEYIPEGPKDAVEREFSDFGTPGYDTPEREVTEVMLQPGVIARKGNAVDVAQPTYSARKAARNAIHRPGHPRQFGHGFEGEEPYPYSYAPVERGPGNLQRGDGTNRAGPSRQMQQRLGIIYSHAGSGEFFGEPVQNAFHHSNDSFHGDYDVPPYGNELGRSYSEGDGIHWPSGDGSGYWQEASVEDDSRGYPSAEPAMQPGGYPRRPMVDYSGGYGNDPYWEHRGDGPQGYPRGKYHSKDHAYHPQDSMYSFPGESWPEFQHQAANPFKVRGEEDEKDVVAKKVQGILNRITPEKYDVLSEQLVNLLSPFMAEETEMATEVCKEVSAKIFEKAIGEPQNSVMYADLVQLLHLNQQRLTQEIRANGKPPANRSIRTLILNRCQRQFYSQPEHSDDVEESQVLHDKHRKRCQGNAKLVAEVYLRKLLPVTIVEEVIQFLIQEKSEVSYSNRMEVLCALLTVAGPQIDWSRPALVDCWAHIEQWCASEETMPRIRFLLQDLIDLRASDWAPRRSSMDSPKKLAEVHRAFPQRNIGVGHHLTSGLAY